MKLAERGVGAVPRCAECPVRESALCGSLSPNGLWALGHLSSIVWFGAGQIIRDERSDTRVVGIVRAGIVRLSKTMSDGSKVTVETFRRGKFFGHLFLRGPGLPFEAATDVELCMVDRQAFERLADEYPQLQRALLAQAMAELEAVRDRLALLTAATAERATRPDSGAELGAPVES